MRGLSRTPLGTAIATGRDSHPVPPGLAGTRRSGAGRTCDTVWSRQISDNAVLAARCLPQSCHLECAYRHEKSTLRSRHNRRRNAKTPVEPAFRDRLFFRSDCCRYPHSPRRQKPRTVLATSVGHQFSPGLGPVRLHACVLHVGGRLSHGAGSPAEGAHGLDSPHLKATSSLGSRDGGRGKVPIRMMPLGVPQVPVRAPITCKQIDTGDSMRDSLIWAHGDQG